MISSIHYDDWLGKDCGIKPHRFKHDGSFNNIVYTAELLLGKAELGILHRRDIMLAKRHIKVSEDGNGLYAPKNSHDNILGLIAAYKVVDPENIERMDVSEAVKGKHPRDRILFKFFLKRRFWHWILLPFALLDMVRAIKVSGKVRPSWTGSKKYFMFRLKILLGLLKPVRSGESIFGGIADFYEYEGKTERVIHVQNDGKILNLLRLSMMREHKILRPFIRYCKKLYISRYGSDFQSILMSNYFEEEDHPVRSVFRDLDRRGITLLDC